MRSGPLRQFGADERGVAAIEMALVGTLLAGALLNVAEVSRYAYLAMEVNAAAQAGAQAAIVKCNPTETPVTINCPEVDDAIETAITGTSLGERITLKAPVDEAWYCLTPAGDLQEMGPPDEKPEDCEEAGVPAGRPALYVRLQTTFTYEPMFPGLTIVQSFAETIERSAMMRLI
jgi:Flp pilus assembly pilin Flp